ncbi:hypothetical protein HaLaN_27156, partial [Haematococcus lacustris]
DGPHWRCPLLPHGGQPGAGSAGASSGLRQHHGG